MKDNKYRFNKIADAKLIEIYNSNPKAKTIKQRIECLRQILGWSKNHYISHFKPGTKLWLKAIEFVYLTKMRLI